MVLETGVELRPDAPIVDDNDRNHLLAVEPQIAKVRFSGGAYLTALALARPNMRFIIRPASEGYSLAEMIEGYRAAVAGSVAIRDKLIGFVVSNEPNYRDKDGRRQNGSWGDEAEEYGVVLDAFFREIGDTEIPLISPPLQRFGACRRWRQVLRQFDDRFDLCGEHIYWNDDNGYAMALGEMLADAWMPRENIIVLEFNSSATWQPEMHRVAECQRAQRLFHAKGLRASILFIGRLPQGHEFVSYVYPWSDQYVILAARPDAPVTPPADDLVARYGEGFARVLRSEGATIGEPAAERVDIATTDQAPAGSDPYRFSHLQTGRGTLLWRKRDNATIFWPFGGRPVGV